MPIFNQLSNEWILIYSVEALEKVLGEFALINYSVKEANTANEFLSLPVRASIAIKLKLHR